MAPPEGKRDVSPASSIMVVESVQPHELSLTANGVAVKLPPPQARGGFFPTGGTLYAYQLPGLLRPDTDYVLSGPDPSAWPADAQPMAELLHFRTASTYDKQPGTAPIVTLFKLWRVRYPLDEINSGNCVFSEYQGYLQLAFDPASFPNTARSDILYELVIQPGTGGDDAKRIAFRADQPYLGYDHSKDPMPLSPTGEWPLELDPTLEYCATLGAQGDGDVARPRAISQPVCAKVVQLSAPGAPPPPTSISSASGCGFLSCSTGGRRGSGVGLLWLGGLVLSVGLRRHSAAR